MKMDNPIPQFEYFISQLAKLHSNLAYIHLIEPGVDKLSFEGYVPDEARPTEMETNDHFRTIWAPRPFISCGNYTREKAIEIAEQKGDIVAFGRSFIANVSYAPKRLFKVTR